MTTRNIQIFVGQSTSFRGVLRDQDGNRIDITSYTLTWKAGDKDFDRTAISLTEGDGITKTDALRGEWRIDLRNGDTNELTRGLYGHQGFASQGSDENRLFTFGKLTLEGIVK